MRFDLDTSDLPHPNTLDLIALDADGAELGRMRVYSVGGGDIQIEGQPVSEAAPEIYPHKSFHEIAEYCMARNLRLSAYVESF